MERATREIYDELIRYMEKDLANCIYMYIDITSYGPDEGPVRTWVQRNNGELSLIAMKYFDSFQLYSVDHDFSYEELEELLEKENSPRINGDKEIIDHLWPKYDDGRYSIEYGTIMKIVNYPLRGESGVNVEVAGLEDVDGIAQLIMDEPELNVGFTKEELAEQTAERIEKGLGESYIIREGDEIVAHNCINAECDKFLVGALTVVRPDRRTTLYGSILDSYLAGVAKAKGKDFYAFLKDPRRIKMFKAMKNEVVGEYGRIKIV